MVERLFLAVPRGCLQFVIVVFPDHTHLLFLNMTIQGFQNIHSYHKITAEVFEFRLFWKLFKNIGFHRN